MKLLKIIAMFAIVSLALGGLARADEAKSESKKAACCTKAESEGKACGHECCVAAAKDGKACEKCGGTNAKA